MPWFAHVPLLPRGKGEQVLPWMIVMGDARQIPLKDNSVQCVVTSPPYWGLRDYGIAEQIGLEKTPELYVEHIVAVFREVWRVLKDDGTVWLNLSSSYAGSWGNYHPDSPPGKHGQRLKETQRWNRPAYESQEFLPPTANIKGFKPKDMVPIPWMVAMAMQEDGWYLRSDIIWSKANPMPESVTDRPTKAHEYIFLLSKKARYYFDQEAVREVSITHDPRRPYTSEGAWQMDGRPQEQRHGGKVRSPAGWKTGPGAHGSIHENGRESETTYVKDTFTRRNIRTVWEMATQPFTEAHFATFPEELAERCIKAGSRVGDMVFDPFSGAGTTPLVADKLNRLGVGLELKPDYCRMAYRRCFNDAPLLAVNP